MPTWNDVSSIYAHYQSAKAPFRRFFRTNSKFMQFIRELIRVHALTDPLIQADKFQLVQKILDYPVKQRTRLSYTIATTQLMALCVTGGNHTVVFNALQFLYQANAFNSEVFDLVTLSDNPVAVAQAILTLDQTLCNVIIYFRLATFYEQGEQGLSNNIAAALSFYALAAKYNHVPSLVYLGDFYQTNHTDFSKDDATSFNYYLQAADQGCTQVLAILERLAKNNRARQQQLLQSRHHQFFAKRRVALLPQATSMPSSQHRR